MKFTTISTLLFVTISSVFAQNTTNTAGPIAVNSPNAGAVLSAPSTVPVKYTLTNPNLKTIKAIVLMGGESTNLQQYLLVDTFVPVSADGIYNWNIPKEVETKPSYSLVFKTDLGDSYSPYFTIIGKAPGTGGLNATSIDFNKLPSGTNSGAQASSTSSNNGGNNSKQEGDKNAAGSLKAGIAGMVGAGVAAAALIL
ncbi:unnamed protein product [Cunninghamella blakesleeana]